MESNRSWKWFAPRFASHRMEKGMEKGTFWLC